MPDAAPRWISGMKVIGLYDVVKRVGREKVMAVSRLNLEVHRGEIVAILGPSGCGKTTILRMMAGFDRPDSGHIVINGRVVASNDDFVPPEERCVGIVLQEFALFPHLTVRQNIAFGLRGKDRGRNAERVGEMIKLTDLEGLEGRYPHQLSGGQQQRVAMARALAPSPSIILLDEPFASIDPDLRSRMHSDLKRILKGTSVAVVLVTHDQEVAFMIADRVAVMSGGRIRQVGTPMEVYRSPRDIFVADFVGKANFIPGRVRSTAAFTEIGEFQLGGGGADEDSEVTVMLRPNDIGIVPTESGIGVIEGVEFMGKDTAYLIRLNSGRSIRSLQDSSYIPAAGTRVNLKVNSSRAVVFDSNSISTGAPADIVL